MKIQFQKYVVLNAGEREREIERERERGGGGGAGAEKDRESCPYSGKEKGIG